MSNLETRTMVKMAIVAAVYAAVTYALAPISYGEIQFRLSEVLVLLAFIDRRYIPGLVLGCVIANLGSPLGPIDVFIGSFATLLSVVAIHKTRVLLGDKLPALFVASLWPVLFNGLLVGWMLNKLFEIPFLAAAGYVAFGEFVVVSILGVMIFASVFSKQAIKSRLILD